MNKRKYKIGVNGWFFCRPFTGIGRYCINLYSELARSFPDLEFRIALPTRLDEEMDKELRYQDNLRFEVVTENLSLKKLHAGLAKANWERTQLHHFFKLHQVDLIHIPYPALYQRVPKVPVVVTVHDTIPWTDEKYRKRGLLSALYNSRTLADATRADFVLTVSESSRSDIMGLPGFDSERLKVVYNASEFNDAPEFQDHAVNELLDHLGIGHNEKYLFYMGGYDERKNVQRLVDIYLKYILPETDLKLVLGGGKVLNNSLYKDVETNSPSVVRTGFLTNQDLIMLYRKAWAFISLTSREGFDLPVLEAITLGCPTIVSDLAVHREIADSAPLFLDLKSGDKQIAEKIVDLYNSRTDYRKLLDKTHSYSVEARDRFSWVAAAKTVGETYLKLM